MTYRIVELNGVKYLPVQFGEPPYEGSLCKYCVFGFSDSSSGLPNSVTRKMCTEEVPRANAHSCDTTDYGIVYASDSEEARAKYVAAKLTGRLERGKEY